MITFKLPKKIDHNNIEMLITSFSLFVKTEKSVIIDCKELKDFNSCALSLFITGKRIVKELIIISPPYQLLILAQAYNISCVLF